MNTCRLTLLSPHRLPTDSSLYLADEDVSAILSGWAALWHPATLSLSGSLPRLSQYYDHETPEAEQFYIRPDASALMLPEDWPERARAAGSLVVCTFIDRSETLAAVLETVATVRPEEEKLAKLIALPSEVVRPFQAIGFGFLVLEALFEAMSHENVLSHEDLFNDLAAALAALEDPDPEAWRGPLQSAADRLLSAREVLYPTSLHLIDLCLGSEQVPTHLEATPAVNLIASGELLQRWAHDQAEAFAKLAECVAAGSVEIVGGVWREREDPLLPVESQLWNLRRGQAVCRELFNKEIGVFARKRSGYSAQLPLLLQNLGIGRSLLLSFDEALVPSFGTMVINWPSHDGKQVDAFTRVPNSSETAQTGFHLAHHLHQTIQQDHAAALVLVQRDKAPADWYFDLMELTRFAPVLGKPITLSNLFNEVSTGDYTGPTNPDEFHHDYLGERTVEGPFRCKDPITSFARQARDRRKIESAWTLATMLTTLGGSLPLTDGEPYFERLTRLEDDFESDLCSDPEPINQALHQAATSLTSRLISRGQANSPGYLILNPCGFTRRVALEVAGVGPLPLAGPIKACQNDADATRLVVEVPPLGFSWFPRATTQPISSAISKMKLADERTVRNETFEAEIDPLTGGLRGIRDLRYRIGRVGQQLVYNPGSTMKAEKITVTSTGPALGEIISEGVLLDEQQQPLARFRQRYRAWLGRPMLDLRIELTPLKQLSGYAWHDYFGARFAWRDENVPLFRGSSCLRASTAENRPISPDFIELRVGKPNTVIFPGGLPFHQRHSGRMVDVLLLCEGETTTTFELGISLDREQPMQTALGYVSPAPVIATTQGPPHIGAMGWLYLLDASNLLLTSMRPGPIGETGQNTGLVATMWECSGYGGQAQLRCAKNPTKAIMQDLVGNVINDNLRLEEDSVEIDFSPNDLVQLLVQFG
jgi:alpha-mannosidase